MPQPFTLSNTTSRAEFSPCGKYRYYLDRTWDATLPKIAFIGLNPSTADANKLDNTTTKCMKWSRRDGFGTYIMLNIFALVSTDPKGLKRCEDPVGPDNNDWLKKTINDVNAVVVAWGANGHPRIKDRVKMVLSWIEQPMCLGWTKGGSPLHPLYLKSSTQIVPFYRS